MAREKGGNWQKVRKKARVLTYGVRLVSLEAVKQGARVATLRAKPDEAIEAIAHSVKKVQHTYRKVDLSEGQKLAKAEVAKGRNSYNAQQYARAQRYFERALEHDPANPWAHLYLGHALYQQGRKSLALGSWHRAVAADPNSDAAAKAQKKIKGLSEQATEQMRGASREVQRMTSEDS